jgi:predicted nuclease with TOPRIM domain
MVKRRNGNGETLACVRERVKALEVKGAVTDESVKVLKDGLKEINSKLDNHIKHQSEALDKINDSIKELKSTCEEIKNPVLLTRNKLIRGLEIIFLAIVGSGFVWSYIRIILHLGP